MLRESLSQTHPIDAGTFDTGRESVQKLSIPILLLIALAFAEYVLPFLASVGLVPRVTLQLSEVLLAIMTVLLFGQMLLDDRIPRVMWLVAALTVLGAVVAVSEGQNAAATLWGWWTLFKYPFVGLLVYLQPEWPERTMYYLRLGLYGLLFTQIPVQLAQYIQVDIPGDTVPGTFGTAGTSKLVIFICLVLAFALAEWLVTGRWRILVLVLLAGTMSSALGAMKLFYPIAAIMSLLAVVFYLIRGHNLKRLLPVILLLAISTPLAVFFYNRVMADVRNGPRLEEFLDLEKTEAYLWNVRYDPTTGTYGFTRGFAVTYGWQSLQRDETTLIAGYGLGARAQSNSLGILGKVLATDIYSASSGTTLLVIMQEFGLVGIVLFGGIWLWLLWLCRTIFARAKETDLRIAAYACLLFSLFWPLWLWYASVWQFGSVMFVYWALLGYLARYCEPLNTREEYA